MHDQQDLELILASHVPLVVVESHEESQFLEMLVRRLGMARARDQKPVFRWSVTDGFQRIDVAMAPQPTNAEPEQVLRHIRSIDLPGIYVLLDLHPFIDDPVIVRLLKDIAIHAGIVDQSIILLSHRIELPPELKPFSAQFSMRMPDEKERNAIVHRVAQEWRSESGARVRIDQQALELLVRNLSGLSRSDTERLARNAIYDDGVLNEADIPEVNKAKYALLNDQGLLHFEYETAHFSDVGGLNNLKAWLEQRQRVLAAPESTVGLDPPRGLLLLGVQGCGKSLAAKAAAGLLGLPLLRLDVGTLYSKFHGETERNLRESLAQAEVMAPCVLWLDEIEKAFATGDGDSGVSRRVLGSFLTWLAEKTATVFVVATANDISQLPPELVRKGRFDEVFFVDLPRQAVRRDIFSIHLAARGLDPKAFDLALLAMASEGFSGAEIEQAVVAALYAAHAQERPLHNDHLRSELARSRPLSILMAEKLARLGHWAADRTVPADRY